MKENSNVNDLKVFANEKLKEVIKKYNIKAPAMLKDLLDKLDIELKVIDKFPNEISNDGENLLDEKKHSKILGALIKREDDKSSTILIPKKMNDIRDEIKRIRILRFTIAHELAHFFLEKNRKFDIFYRINNEPLSEKEKIMDNFAIKLLVGDLEKFEEDTKNLCIAKIAKIYLISLENVLNLKKEIEYQF